MKCAGLQPGDEVLSNAFTFGAVPSAIEHAGGKVRVWYGTLFLFTYRLSAQKHSIISPPLMYLSFIL
jgi:hypothetical protein